jgi:hypothetical protein
VFLRLRRIARFAQDEIQPLSPAPIATRVADEHINLCFDYSGCLWPIEMLNDYIEGPPFEFPSFLIELRASQ